MLSIHLHKMGNMKSSCKRCFWAEIVAVNVFRVPLDSCFSAYLGSVLYQTRVDTAASVSICELRRRFFSFATLVAMHIFISFANVCLGRTSVAPRSLSDVSSEDRFHCFPFVQVKPLDCQVAISTFPMLTLKDTLGLLPRGSFPPDKR